jgi:UDP-N-acetyl-D-glucosamine dehydrogenase
MLADNGATVGEDLYLTFLPEPIDPGNEEYGPTDIPKILGGVTDECGDRAETLYTPVFDQVVRVDSSRGRTGQTAREHVPGSQHRSHQ